MSQETISCEGFLCSPDCKHCSKYILENPAVVNFYGGFHKYFERPMENINGDEYIVHVMKRLMSLTKDASDHKFKIIGVTLLLEFLLTNYSYLREKNIVAATCVTKLNLLESNEWFITYVSERGIRTDLWREYFTNINEKRDWKSDFICDSSCVHCQRFSETDIVKNLYMGISRKFTKAPIYKNDGDEYLEHIFRRLEHMNRNRREYNAVLVNVIAADIGLSNVGFLMSHKEIALNIFNFLSVSDDPDMKALVNDTGIDIKSWLGYFKDICFIPKHTDHEDLIYKTEFEAGERYVECSFTDEHVVNYEFIKTFQKTTTPSKMKCPYCTNNIKEDIYEQV